MLFKTSKTKRTSGVRVIHIIIIQLNCVLLAYGNECKHLRDLKKKKLKVKCNYDGNGWK